MFGRPYNFVEKKKRTKETENIEEVNTSHIIFICWLWLVKARN